MGKYYVITLDGKITEGNTPMEEGSTLYFIPDALAAHIIEKGLDPECSFCGKTKTEVGTPVIEGKNANICYGCIAINKNKLDKGEEK